MHVLQSGSLKGDEDLHIYNVYDNHVKLLAQIYTQGETVE